MPPLRKDEGIDELTDSGDRDSAVLRVIGQEELEGFTFEGLKRKLGTHSETLSRILSRMEGQGLLAKGEHGYVVTELGRYMAGATQLADNGQGVVLLRTLLPEFMDNSGIISGLMGRWFGPLRWLGYSLGEAGTTLKWVTENGTVQVEATFTKGELVVEGKLTGGNGLSDAISASHQLIGYISKMYTQPSHRLAYSRPEDPAPFEN